MVHGLMSGPKAWEPLRELIAADRGLGFVEPLTFEYATGLLSVHPLQVFPSIDTVADSLKEYLATEAGAFDQLLLVTHSQGGLVAQRYLARMLHDGRGGELARIQRLVMLACPSNGSELLLSLRRRVLGGRHPQEGDLRPLNDQVNATLRTIVRDVVHATAVTDRTCPIPVSVYAGESDGVVSRASAQSVFPDSSALPGDHSGILKADSPQHRTFTALRRLILATRSEPYVPVPEPEARPDSAGLITLAPAAEERPGKRRGRATAIASVAALAAIASVLRFAPMPWESSTDSNASNPAQTDPKPLDELSDTERVFIFGIDKNPRAEYVRVYDDQTFDFWWNVKFDQDGLLHNDGRGKNSYKPASGSKGAALRFGNIDGDGRPDCIVVDKAGGVTVHTWIENNSSGTRMCMEEYTGDSDVTPGDHLDNVKDIKEIQFADIDGDGLADYLRIEPDGRVTVWYNWSTGKYSQTQVRWSPPEEISQPISREGELRFADINGDGFGDKILITPEGGALAWKAKSAGTFAKDTSEIMKDTGIPPEEIQFADIDGDGYADFLHVDKRGKVRSLCDLTPGNKC